MAPSDVLLVAAGGAAGAVSRYGVSVILLRLLGSGFPWGTLAVNVLGCLALGGLLELAAVSDELTRGARLALGTGFLGAFTTFSTFGVETLRLAEADGAGWAAANIAANVVIGLVAAWAGVLLARHLT